MMTHFRLILHYEDICTTFFENNVFIINNELLNLKIWTNQLSRLLINSRIHIEFHSKLFILIKHGLKDEIIKLNVKFFFAKLQPNHDSYEFFKGPKLDLVFKSLFEIISFFLCPMGI